MSKVFFTTHWTQVLATRGEGPAAQQALSDLCAAYYEPVVTFIRQSGYLEDPARELAHEFFVRVLDRQSLEGADPRQGRFRTYLLGAVKHFLANARTAAHRAKRGAGLLAESSESPTHSALLSEIPDTTTLPPDWIFDREWAMHLLERALRVLADESQQAGHAEQFATLKPWLTGDRPELTQADVARQLGLSDGAVRVAIHRLRRRFRAVVKAEIRETVPHPEDVEAELQHLIAVLAHPPV